MRAYLFDASAIVEYYERRNSRAVQIIDFIVEQRVRCRDAALYLPTVCIAEVFNVFAKFHFEKKLSLPKYHELLQRFRKHLHWAAVFYPYDVSRYHVLAVDEIIPYEYEVPRMGTKNRSPERDRLSGVDLLLIAMGAELAYLYGSANVFIVSGDSRIKRVCDHIRAIPPRERGAKRIARELGQPNVWRWPIAEVFDIFDDVPGRLPTCMNQSPLNIHP